MLWNVSKTQLLNGLCALAAWGFGEEVIACGNAFLIGQYSQKLARQFRIVFIAACLPHFKKLGFAVGAISKAGVGQPNSVFVNAAQH